MKKCIKVIQLMHLAEENVENLKKRVGKDMTALEETKNKKRRVPGSSVNKTLGLLCRGLLICWELSCGAENWRYLIHFLLSVD